MQDLVWIKPYYLRQIEKLDEIHTTIGVFYVGNERLMSIESFGDSSLCQTRQLSLLSQQLSKSPMTVRMQGFGHPLVE
ncbi:hypothetical protein X744_06170 [Mesorhizobium sp. LNJC372A00]|nr:hypothetical protein X745_06025 [Mesorhizobium sp. LNJC374B00]ESY61307.1 hypothetical protein X744_06170 [Mesorhizobium sp. LNJC372A00]